MTSDDRRFRVLVVDPFAEDRGHLIQDDLFWAECLAPVTSRLEVWTSRFSAENIRRRSQVVARAVAEHRWCGRFFRIRLLLVVLALRCREFDHILFVSFEEVSALVFMLIHPRTHVHLIVSNNLSLERIRRHPLLGGLILGSVLRRASTVFVRSRFEVELIRSRYTRGDVSHVVARPCHQIGAQRRRPTWAERSRYVLFVGPETSHKSVAPLLQLVRHDTSRAYRYVLCGMRDMDTEVRVFLAAQPHVELSTGFVEDERYYALIANAALVILTHDRRFEGLLSGVLSDSIASGTPVIARDMAPHDEFFDRFGRMGLLVDFAAPRWWEGVLAIDIAACYDEFQRNMARCRAASSADAIRETIRAALERAQSRRRGQRLRADAPLPDGEGGA